MDRYLLYQFNDMAHTVACTNSVSCLVRPVIHSYESISFLINKLFLDLFAVPLGINLLFIFFSLLCLLSSFYFFTGLHPNKTLAIAFSFAYTFSNYVMYRLFSYTYNLFPVFLFPLLLALLFKGKLKTVPVILVLSYGLSVYYCYYLFVITSLFFCYQFITNKNKISQLRNYGLVLGVSLFLILVFTGRFFANNIPLFGKYETPDKTLDSTNLVYRPIEDWYNFSIVPWYFGIPPKDSKYFGRLSGYIYNSLENTGYYLAQNYESSEMAGLYLGWHISIGILVAIIIVLFGRRFFLKTNVYFIKDRLQYLLILLLGIVLISLPPSFTINGIEFFTPSYVLYHLIAPLRVSTRWASVIVLSGLSINYLLVAEFLSRKKNKLFQIGIPITFLLVNYFITSVNVPLVDTKAIPSYMTFLKNETSCESYAEYPKGTYESLFWSGYIKKRLVNVSGYYYFPSGEIVKQKDLISSQAGLTELKNTNACMLVLNKNAKSVLKSDIEFFTTQFGEPIYGTSQISIFTMEGNK